MSEYHVLLEQFGARRITRMPTISILGPDKNDLEKGEWENQVYFLVNSTNLWFLPGDRFRAMSS